MSFENLENYFLGIGAKRLSEVEVSPEVSNQHEFNGIAGFKKIFGSQKIIFNAKFVQLNDEGDEILEDTGTLTWYDARENHPTRTEFRLYYSNNAIIQNSNPGDLIVICKSSEDQLLVISAPKGSTAEGQILWLFRLSNIGDLFEFKDFSEEEIEVDFVSNYILDSIGIEVTTTAEDYLDELLANFGPKFPKTKDFSEYARQTLRDFDSVGDPDGTLIRWLEQEELLFRTLEKHIVQKKLKDGFGTEGIDVDEFISFSLSVQNRRKSRAGHAFENHLVQLFNDNGVNFSKGARTERNNKPDFVFPGINEYSDPSFSQELLTILGVKTSAKDRWRQVLSEADRVSLKHLATLQPSITKNQTDEMFTKGLILVVPSPIQPTYSDTQLESILSIQDFIKIVKAKQS